eukprot:TRINITY_DN3814_c1_g1_i6.p1 TRINITY_DN3814_c1_g1~~TRINITY_DN3814_c1_g1_i6.p1  ORF type:complete len:1205 (-),score=152.52 TRINITY_DN3814_c1_g1_i6:24-3638(-)
MVLNQVFLSYLLSFVFIFVSLHHDHHHVCFGAAVLRLPGRWYDGSIWEGGILPVSNDNVTITACGAVIIEDSLGNPIILASLIFDAQACSSSPPQVITVAQTLIVNGRIHGSSSTLLRLAGSSVLTVSPPPLSSEAMTPMIWDFALEAYSADITFRTSSVVFVQSVYFEGIFQKKRDASGTNLKGSSLTFLSPVVLVGNVITDVDVLRMSSVRLDDGSTPAFFIIKGNKTYISDMNIPGSTLSMESGYLHLEGNIVGDALSGGVESTIVFDRSDSVWNTVVMTASSLSLSGDTRLLVYNFNPAGLDNQLLIHDSSLLVNEPPRSQLYFSSISLRGAYSNVHLPGTLLVPSLSIESTLFNISSAQMTSNMTNIKCLDDYECSHMLSNGAVLHSFFDTIIDVGRANYTFIMTVPIEVSTLSAIVADGGPINIMTLDTTTTINQTVQFRGGVLKTNNTLYISAHIFTINDVIMEVFDMVVWQSSSIVFYQTKAVHIYQNVIMHPTAYIVFGPCDQFCAAHSSVVPKILSVNPNIVVSGSALYVDNVNSFGDLELYDSASVVTNFPLPGPRVSVNGVLFVEGGACRVNVTPRGLYIRLGMVVKSSFSSTTGATNMTTRTQLSFESGDIVFGAGANIAITNATVRSYTSQTVVGQIRMENAQWIGNNDANIIFGQTDFSFYGINYITGGRVEINGIYANFTQSIVIIDAPLTVSPNYRLRALTSTISELVLTDTFSWLYGGRRRRRSVMTTGFDSFRPPPQLAISGPAKYISADVLNEGIFSPQPRISRSILINSLGGDSDAAISISRLSGPRSIKVEGTYNQTATGILKMSLFIGNGTCDTLHATNRNIEGAIEIERIILGFPSSSLLDCPLVVGPRLLDENYTTPETWMPKLPAGFLSSPASSTTTVSMMGNMTGIYFTLSNNMRARCPRILPYACDTSSSSSSSSSSSPSYNFYEVTNDTRINVNGTSTRLWHFDSVAKSTLMTRIPLVCFAYPAQCSLSSSNSSSSSSSSSSSQCVSQSPFRCVISGVCVSRPPLCNTDSSVCWDGSSSSPCPVLPRCPTMTPQRCSDGSCVALTRPCPTATDDDCTPTTRKCEDGLCRLFCPPYDGCGLSNPIQCPNSGRCVTSSSHCTASNSSSSCPTSQCSCVDGTCMDDCTMCSVPLLYQKPTPLKVLLDLETDGAIIVPLLLRPPKLGVQVVSSVDSNRF